MLSCVMAEPKPPPVFNGKQIAPWLSVAAEIHMKYFSDNPTVLELKDLKDEITLDHVDLSLRELAAVLVLVDTQYAEMKKKLSVKQ